MEMHHAHNTLRKAGGSIMLVVPPAFLDQLRLQAGATVSMTISDGHLVIDPKPRPRYTLAELLANSDFSQPQAAEERDWVVLDLGPPNARKVDTVVV